MKTQVVQAALLGVSSLRYVDATYGGLEILK